MTEEDDITPSKIERLVLLNQYRIMSILEPSERSHRTAMEALTDGHALPITELTSWIFDGLSTEECKFVLRTMSMYDALQRSHEELGTESPAKAHEVEFHGFDGNNEGRYMSYARFVVDHEQRFTYLRPEKNDFNSHMPTVHRYRAQLAVWRGPLDERYSLTAPEMRDILDAR